MENLEKNKVCPNCGVEFGETAKFCIVCGHQLQMKEVFSEVIPESVPEDVPEEKVTFTLRKIAFQFDDAPFDDSRYDFSLLLDGRGIFAVGVSLTKSEYDEMLNANEGEKLPEVTEDMVPELQKNFEKAFLYVMANLREPNLTYDRLPFITEDLLEPLNAVLEKQWNAQGLSVLMIQFNSLYPDEKSTLAMAKFHREHKSFV